MENNKGQQMKERRLKKNYYQGQIQRFLKNHSELMEQPFIKWAMVETLEDIVRKLSEYKEYIERIENYDEYEEINKEELI